MKMKLCQWELNAIENRLDRLGLAFIEFNEFNEFSREFHVQWDEKLHEHDLESIL